MFLQNADRDVLNTTPQTTGEVVKSFSTPQLIVMGTVMVMIFIGTIVTIKHFASVAEAKYGGGEQNSSESFK